MTLTELASRHCRVSSALTQQVLTYDFSFHPDAAASAPRLSRPRPRLGRSSTTLRAPPGGPRPPGVGRLLTFSPFNYGFWSWLVYLLLMGRRPGRPRVTALAWSCVLFVSPVALGVVTSLLSHRVIVGRLLAATGSRPSTRSQPRGATAFSQPPRILGPGDPRGSAPPSRVHSQDRSFASSDRSERDLSLQRVYRVERRRDVATRADDRRRPDSRTGDSSYRVHRVQE